MIEVRRSGPNDLDGIFDVFRSVYNDRHPYSVRTEIEKDLANPVIFSYTALMDGKIAGYGQLRQPEYPFLSFERQALEISRLGVRSELQGKGVGKALMAKLEEAIDGEDPLIVCACMQTADERSQHLLAPLGLFPVALFQGLAPDFFDDGQASSVLMGMCCRRVPVYPATLYLTPRLERLAQFVVAGIGLHREFLNFAEPPENSEGFLKQLALHRETFESHIRSGGFHFGFVTVDLSSPEAPAFYAMAHEAGFTVEGLVPMVPHANGSRSDHLVMRLVPPGIDDTRIRLVIPGATELKEILDTVG
jgi:ribosomal protein S18 acetylase RimI-like enzyme